MSSTPYATAQDLVDRFGEAEMIALTDPAYNARLDEAALMRAIEDAQGLVNAAIANHLPLSEVPSLITRLTADIARYLLHDDRAPSAVSRRYEEAMALLTRIGKGELSLVGDGAGLGGSGGGNASTDGPKADAPARRFTHETLKDF